MASLILHMPGDGHVLHWVWGRYIRVHVNIYRLHSASNNSVRNRRATRDGLIRMEVC